DPIDASLTVDPEEITAEDLANKDKGVEVTVSGVKKGDKVTDSLTDNEKSVASDGDFTFGVYYKGNSEDLEEGPVPFEVTIDREGTESETLSGTITVVDDTEVDPSVKLESKKITLEDFKKDGLEFTGSGFSPNGTVSVKGEAISTQRAAPQSDEPRADEDGNVHGVVTAPESLEVGTYALTFTDDVTGETTDAVEVTVTEDEDAVDPIDASLTVDPEEITAEDLANKDKGVDVTVSGVKKGDRIKDSLTGKTETAEADGDHVLHVWWDGNPGSLEAGEVPFEVTIDREGTESETLNGTITVVDEDEPEAPAEVDPSIKLESKKITVEDFKKDGLEFTGSGFSPNGTVSVKGEAISTQRAAPQSDEPRADEDGNVHGVVTAPESLEVGTYALTFTDDVTGETTDAVEVTVTEDEDAVDPIDASLTVDPEEITAEDLANKDKGVDVTVSGVKKGHRIKGSLTGKTETAEADGDHVLHVWWDGNPDSLEAGEVPFEVTIDREGTESETLNGTITVVDEDEPEAPAEASLT